MSRKNIQERNRAIRLAWERERELVSVGKGTRDWTEDQQRDILDPDKGKAYDDDGRAFEGQHMKSASEYPEYQGDPDNIQFLTRDEHLKAHKGNWQNATNWYYNPKTNEFMDFGENKPVPCERIRLSDPIVGQPNSPMNDQDGTESASEWQDDSETSDNPDEVPAENEIRENAPAQTSRLKQNTNGTKDGLAGKIINAIKRPVIKGAKWIWNHKEDVILGVGATIAAKMGYDIYKTRSNTGNSSDNRYLSSSDIFNSILDNDTNLSSFVDDMIPEEEESEKSSHASPRKHTVKPHGQHYGKDKIWKEKESYTRGGKNKDDE